MSIDIRVVHDPTQAIPPAPNNKYFSRKANTVYFKNMKLSLCLAPVLFLAACAIQPVQQSPLALKKTHGFVHVSLPVEFEVGSLNVTLRSLTTGSEFSLSPTELNSQSLALWVPADSYEIAEMVGKDKNSYLPIQVKPEQITDLGGLTWASVGGRERVLLPLRHPELEAQLASVKSKLNEHTSAEVIEWKPSTPPKARDQRP